MPNIAAVLKEEIRRLARKEAKAQTGPLKKALVAERKAATALRREIAAHKRALTQLTRAVKHSARAGGTAASVDSALPPGAKWRKDTVRSTRRKLGVTQAELAKLAGVSPITVSFWETGRSTPRTQQQASVLAARALSKEEAHARLGRAGGKGRKRGSKARRKVVRRAGRRKTGRAKKA